MKVASLLLLILSAIACLVARPLLVESASPLPWGEGVPRPAVSSAGAGRVRGLSVQPSRSINRSTQSSNNRPRSIRANSSIVHKPATNKPAGAAKRVTRAAAPTSTNVRHRSPNPAVIGGPAADKANETGSLSGTRMNRRH